MSKRIFKGLDNLKKKSKHLPAISEEYTEKDMLSSKLKDDVQKLKNIFYKSFDIVFREFEIGGMQKGVLIYLDGFVNIELIDSDVIKPLLSKENLSQVSREDIKNLLQNQVIEAAQISWGCKINEVVDHIISGDTVLLIDKVQEALFISLKKLPNRSVSQPAKEEVIRGPREAFTEDLRTNTALIRKRLKTTKLEMEKICIGRLSKTDIVIAYLKGIANDSVVSEVYSRISKIDIDGILDSGYIEELIEDNPYSIFPQATNTERPDRVAASLLEGQIAIIVDNTPEVLIVPRTFFQMMQSNEDHYERYIYVIFIRLMRYLFLFVALTLPSIYIALTTFHQEMISTKLLFSMSASREAVPFPALIEALIMEVFFEVLREAGVRLPRPVGQAVSIVGAFIIGEAAVNANIISAPMVIIVSLTGIASFIIPSTNQSLAIRLLRFPLMLVSSTLGLYGMVLFLLIILTHMCKLRSFGVPYMSPIAPLELSSLKDVFIRVPRWAMITRPKYTETNNSIRQKDTLLNHRSKRSK